MADPWMMLAVMASSEDCWSRNTVRWEWLLIANLSAVIGIFRHLGAPFCRYISDASSNYVSVILAEIFARY